MSYVDDLKSESCDHTVGYFEPCALTEFVLSSDQTSIETRIQSYGGKVFNYCPDCGTRLSLETNDEARQRLERVGK